MKVLFQSFNTSLQNSRHKTLIAAWTERKLAYKMESLHWYLGLQHIIEKT